MYPAGCMLRATARVLSINVQHHVLTHVVIIIILASDTLQPSESELSRALRVGRVTGAVTEKRMKNSIRILFLNISVVSLALNRSRRRWEAFFAREILEELFVLRDSANILRRQR